MTKITEHDCYLMSEWRDGGIPVSEIATVFTCSEGTVYTHTNGNCSHKS